MQTTFIRTLQWKKTFWNPRKTKKAEKGQLSIQMIQSRSELITNYVEKTDAQSFRNASLFLFLFFSLLNKLLQRWITNGSDVKVGHHSSGSYLFTSLAVAYGWLRRHRRPLSCRSLLWIRRHRPPLLLSPWPRFRNLYFLPFFVVVLLDKILFNPIRRLICF